MSPSDPWFLSAFNANQIGVKLVKKTGGCPKCDSQDILHVPGWRGGYGSGNYALVETRRFFPTWAKIARYICTQCGFCEEWVDVETELEKVKAHYEKTTTSS